MNNKMQASVNSNGRTYCNFTIQRIKLINTKKNDLIKIMTDYIDKIVTSDDTIKALTTMSGSTCNITTKVVDGVPVPGIVKLNRDCDC